MSGTDSHGSDTPRTDKAWSKWAAQGRSPESAPWDFARQLERELAEAKAAKDALAKAYATEREELLKAKAALSETRRMVEALSWYADKSKWHSSDDGKTSEIRAGDAWSVAEDALKKADLQGTAEQSGERSRCDAGAKTGVGQPAPAASAPCVAGITGGEPEGGSSRPAQAGSTPAASHHISYGEQVPTQEQWKAWAEYACRRFKEETGKDLQAEAGT